MSVELKNDTFKAVPYTETAYNKAVSFLERVKKKTDHSLQAFTYITEKNTFAYKNTEAACYYPLNFQISGNKEKMVLFADYSLYKYKKNKIQMNHDKAIEYLRYMANDSLFSVCYVDKDPEVILERGCVFNCTYPLRFTLHAAMAIRYLSEHMGLINSWFEYKKYVDPHSAWVLAHKLSERSGRLTLNHSYDGHCLLDYLDQDGFIRIMNKDLIGFKDQASIHEVPYEYCNLSFGWNLGKNNFNKLNKLNINNIGDEETVTVFNKEIRVHSLDANKLEKMLPLFISHNMERKQ